MHGKLGPRRIFWQKEGFKISVIESVLAQARYFNDAVMSGSRRKFEDDVFALGKVLFEATLLKPVKQSLFAGRGLANVIERQTNQYSKMWLQFLYDLMNPDQF